MRKHLLILCIVLLCLGCNSRKEVSYTPDEFQELFSGDFLYPMGTFFWDEFKDLEEQYSLSPNESKLLGKWINETFVADSVYNYYSFFPNKLFILDFDYKNFQLVDSEETYYNKALGTWELVDDMVRITIHSIVTADATQDHRNNKGILFVEHPYSFDFVNINDIDEMGYTRRPVNNKPLSKELLKRVAVKKRNKTNNRYVRNVYSLSPLAFDEKTGGLLKLYGYFDIVPRMARENLSGLEVATNPDLIRKYIFTL